jgi:betaine-aldehyde dehydrogenase
MSDLFTRPEVFVGGHWVASRGGVPHAAIDPSTGAEFGTATLATPADVDAAVEAARTSFDSGVWADRPVAERAAVIRAAADHIEALGGQAVDLLTRELGCPRWFSERAHVPNPLRHLRYYADLIETEPLEEIRTDGTNRSLVVREPVGVVGAISPWNGPLSSPAIKIGPALAAGCSVVLKPPPETPLTAYLLADAFEAAGLPDGVFSVLPGDRDTGAHLVQHPQVDKVAFTGSTAAGRKIMADCAQRIARVTLELGGKSAAIVLDDADLETFVRTVIPMAFTVNGQLCIAQTRLLVPRHRTGEVTDALMAAFANLPVGDPFDASTQIGPLVSERQRERVEGYLQLAGQEGARVLGGARPSGLESGFYVCPALLTDVDNGMRVAQEEIFGPVLALIPYDTEDEAVRIANDSVYGLSGSIWTADRDHGVQVARRIRTGMLSINGAPQSWGTPFGGFKQSGIGREMGPEGLRAFHELKSIALGPA